MNEKWIKINGYEDYYVSNHGRIKSYKNNNHGSILKPSKNNRGYMNIVLVDKNKNKKTFSLHRIVALSFIKNDEMKSQVNHIDFDKTNNNVNNLEWCTPKENMKHCKDGGRQVKGSNQWKAKLNESKVRIIKYLLARDCMSQKEIGDFFNVKKETINHIKTKKNWEHV